MIAPTLYCDVNGEYRGMNDMIYTDPKKANYTTLSLWDTYRALNPLMTIIQPEMVDNVINSMLSIYRQQDKDVYKRQALSERMLLLLQRN